MVLPCEPNMLTRLPPEAQGALKVLGTIANPPCMTHVADVTVHVLPASQQVGPAKSAKWLASCGVATHELEKALAFGLTTARVSWVRARQHPTNCRHMVHQIGSSASASAKSCMCSILFKSHKNGIHRPSGCGEEAPPQFESSRAAQPRAYEHGAWASSSPGPGSISSSSGRHARNRLCSQA